MQKLTSWNYNHKQYLYSRVFSGEECISDNSFEKQPWDQYKIQEAARTSHNRKGYFGIFSKCCSYKGIMFYMFWDKEHHFWKKKDKSNKHLYVI